MNSLKCWVSILVVGGLSLQAKANLTVGDSIIASTYFGTSGVTAEAMARDKDGNVYIVGSSSEALPVTSNAYDKVYNSIHSAGGSTFYCSDAFVAKLSPDLSSVLACTYIGGWFNDKAHAVFIDKSGAVYVAGETYSKDFPVTATAFDTSHELQQEGNYASTNGYVRDVFIVKMSSDLSTLLAGTYIGGDSTDIPRGLGVDGVSGRVYVSGYTLSSTFPTTSGSLYSARGAANTSSFISCLSSDLDTLVASTYMPFCTMYALAFDKSNNLWIAGSARSGLPVHSSAYQSTPTSGSSDAFVARMQPDLAAVTYATYIGSSIGDEALAMAFGNDGSVYIAGNALTNDYPLTTGAFKTTWGGGYEVFISRFNSELSSLLASTFLFSNTTAGQIPQTQPVKSLAVDGNGDVVISATVNVVLTAGDNDQNVPLMYNSYDRSCGTDGTCNYDLYTNYIKDDVYYAKLNGGLTALKAATYFGGSLYDRKPLMIVEPDGKILTAIYTSSDNLPLQTSSFQKTKAATYIARFSSDLAGYPCPDVPILDSPADSATNISSAVTVRWHPAQNAVSYRVTVTLVSSSAVVFDTIVSDTTFTATSLAWNSKYMWKVKAKNARYESSYAPRIFTTALEPLVIPDAPILSTPVNNLITVSVSASFYWNKDSLTTHTHTIQIATDATFNSGLIVNSSGVNNDYYSYYGLQHGTNYYWRVKASNRTGESPWSETRTLRVVDTPAVPVLVSPLTGDTNTSLTPTFCWHPGTDAQTYILRICTIDKELNQFNSNSVSTSDTFIVLPNRLTSRTKYHWAVAGVNGYATSSFTSEWNFTTGEITIPSPANLLPANGAVDQPIKLSIKWDTVSIASSYWLQTAFTPDFAVTLTDQTGIRVNTYSLYSLLTSSTYYWRVACYADGKFGAWSDVWSFATLPPAPSAAYTLLPAKAATLAADSTVFSWMTASPRIDRYCLEIGADSLMTTFVYKDSTLTDTAKALGGFIDKTTYWWRVKAHNVAGWGSYSTLNKFSVAIPSTSVQPTEYSFRFTGISNCGLSIRYALPVVSDVSIKMYTLQGKQIRILNKPHQMPGRYSFPLNVAALSTGNYLLEFNAGSYNIKKRLFISK